MPQSFTKRAVDATSKAAQSALAGEGFRRKSIHLLRGSSDVFHGVHFQSSKWGTADEGSFTVNFIVTWPAIYEAWTGKPLPANPATASYPICVRIGDCLPRRKDIWWDVTPQTDLAQLAHEVGATIAQLAPAFFARFPSTGAVLSGLQESSTLAGLPSQHASLVRAHLEQVAGNNDEAEKVLDAALRTTKSVPFKGSIRLFANRTRIKVANDA